jgi:hypothetical protein
LFKETTVLAMLAIHINIELSIDEVIDLLAKNPRNLQILLNKINNFMLIYDELSKFCKGVLGQSPHWFALKYYLISPPPIRQSELHHWLH